MNESEYPDDAVACEWTDKVFERDHLIEVTSEPYQIGNGTYVTGIRVAAGETGNYNIERLRPLTWAARKMLRTEN